VPKVALIHFAENSTVGGGDKASQQDDPILTDPNEAYRTEVTQALKDAMLARGVPFADVLAIFHSARRNGVSTEGASPDAPERTSR